MRWIIFTFVEVPLNSPSSLSPGDSCLAIQSACCRRQSSILHPPSSILFTPHSMTALPPAQVHPQPPLAVIFDMDGVLVDSYRAHWESWQFMADELGKGLTEA